MLHAGHGVLWRGWSSRWWVLEPHVVHADGLCDPGWAWFQDLSLLEQKAAPLSSRSTGSCLRLFPASAASSSRGSGVFAIEARAACAAQHVGGRLLSLNSMSRASDGLLSTVLALTVVASTQLVLTGGVQQVCPTNHPPTTNQS